MRFFLAEHILLRECRWLDWTNIALGHRIELKGGDKLNDSKKDNNLHHFNHSSDGWGIGSELLYWGKTETRGINTGPSRVPDKRNDFTESSSDFIKNNSFCYEVDPMTCPKCSGKMRILSFIEDPDVIKKILKHLGLWDIKARPPPKRANAPPPETHTEYSHSQVPLCEDYLYCDPDYPIETYAS